MSLCSIYLRLIGVCLLIKDSLGLTLIEVRIPNHIVRDQSARLECHFDLNGETLYSVKWYKDGNEFYRYIPQDVPPAHVFPLPGINVDVNNSSESQILVSSVNLSSSGRYRCEVSGEAPSFQTVTQHGDMIVVALPEEGPQITGGKIRYQKGDTIRVNCTSRRSKPAAQIHWFINGEPANHSYLRGPDITITGREGLETVMLGLEFEAHESYFKNGDMKIKCIATIATIYWRSSDQRIEIDKTQRSTVLGSREMVLPSSNSRADKVQAENSCISFYPCMIIIVACSLITLLQSNIRSSLATKSPASLR